MHDPETGLSEPNLRTITWGYVLARSYGLYGQRFWTYFSIALLPAVVVSGFHYLEKSVYPRLFHALPRWSPKFALLGVFQGWSEGAVYWMISAFFFAAIAANVLGTPRDSPLSDAYSPARMRLRPVVAIALLTWTIFWIGRGAIFFAAFELLGRSSWIRNYWAVTLAGGALLLALATPLSKFGLVIPELIAAPSTSLGHTLRNSLKMTQHWELFFMLFLLKSALVGYGMFWLCNLALDELWDRGLLTPEVAPYVTWLVSVSIAAMLESPLFISFSVLYAELKNKQDIFVAVHSSAWTSAGGKESR
jgi:hypothetical protein